MTTADERIINRLERIAAAQGEGGAAFADITGEPTDNAALGSALNGKVPTSRTVNGQALSGDVVVTGRMLDTAGAPDNGVGANGDYAFDDATKTMYGPKAGGVWPAGVVLGGQSEAQVQALIDGQFGTASVLITGGTTVTLSHGFGLFGSGMSTNYAGTGVYEIFKSTPFTPTTDSRDYAVTATLAFDVPFFSTVEKVSDSQITVRVFDVAGSPADPVAPFALSIQSIAPPP